MKKYLLGLFFCSMANAETVTVSPFPISNANLSNSAVTIGSTSVSLGNTASTIAGLTLTAPVISTISNTGTLTLPTSTDTLMGAATTNTMTGKTYDTAGSGNVFKINGTGITAVTGTGSAVLATSPTISSSLTVNKNVSTAGSPVGGIAIFGGVDGSSSGITSDAFGGSTNNFVGRLSQGTSASKTAVQSSNALLTLRGEGYGATAYNSSLRVGLALQAAENWTDTSQGTKFVFSTTTAGSLTLVSPVAISSALLAVTGAITASTTISATGAISSKGISYTTSLPTISSCGTSPTVDSHASNNAGTVTVGTVTATSCTITFATAFSTFNHCRITSQTAITAMAYSYTLSAITVTGTSLVGDLIDYQCDGI